MPWAHSHSSQSQPWGLRAPCGALRRSVQRQRSPAETAGHGAVPAPRGAYHVTSSRCGSSTACPLACCACSTTSCIRRPWELRAGRASTTAITSTSTPSKAGAMRWACRPRACHPVSAKDAAAAQTTIRTSSPCCVRRAPACGRAHMAAPPSNTAATPSTAYTQPGHRAGCSSCSATPAVAARAQIVGESRTAVHAEAKDGSTLGILAGMRAVVTDGHARAGTAARPRAPPHAPPAPIYPPCKELP